LRSPGRCRDCEAPISWRYPLGEAVTAALFATIAWWDGLSWLLLPHLLFVAALIVVSEVDLEIKIIPNVIILPAAVVGIPLMIWLGDGPWWEGLAAGGAAAGFLFLIGEVYFRVRHIDGMGLGDVKLALCMGVYLGVAVIPALFIGFFSGALIGMLLIAVRKGDSKTAIPFGPFLAAGAVVALFVGQRLIDVYVGLAFPQ